jgi:hypothetical protein
VGGQVFNPGQDLVSVEKAGAHEKEKTSLEAFGTNI